MSRHENCQMVCASLCFNYSVEYKPGWDNVTADCHDLRFHQLITGNIKSLRSLQYCILNLQQVLQLNWSLLAMTALSFNKLKPALKKHSLEAQTCGSYFFTISPSSSWTACTRWLHHSWYTLSNHSGNFVIKDHPVSSCYFPSSTQSCAYSNNCLGETGYWCSWALAKCSSGLLLCRDTHWLLQ